MTNRNLLVIVCALGTVLAIGCGGTPDAGSPKPGLGRLDDGQVLAIYNQANSFDIETGQLGDTRGASEDVRQLGRMVVADHTAVREQASELGVKLGLAPKLPAARAEAAAAHDRTLAELRGLSGPAFDRAYLRHEIAFHTDAIAAVKTVLIPATSSAQLKQLMIDILPGFQHHLDETRRVAGQLGYE